MPKLVISFARPRLDRPMVTGTDVLPVERQQRIDDRTEELICQGVDPTEARRQAELEEGEAA